MKTLIKKNIFALVTLLTSFMFPAIGSPLVMDEDVITQNNNQHSKIWPKCQLGHIYNRRCEECHALHPNIRQTHLRYLGLANAYGTFVVTMFPEVEEQWRPIMNKLNEYDLNFLKPLVGAGWALSIAKQLIK